MLWLSILTVEGALLDILNIHFAMLDCNIVGQVSENDTGDLSFYVLTRSVSLISSNFLHQAITKSIVDAS